MISGGPKQNKKKCCASKHEYKVLTALVSDPNDNAAVASLPDQWEPKRGGKILESYLEQRETNFNNLLADMRSEANYLNKDIDRRVRRLSEELLEHVRQYQYDIDQVITCKANKGAQNINSNVRQEKLKILNAKLLEYKHDVAEFRREALILERERSESLKRMMRIFFERLIANGARTPKDLLHEFDTYFFEINQQLLSNDRSYAELEAQLLSYACQCNIQTRSILNQMMLNNGMSSARRSRSALPRSSDHLLSKQRSNSASDVNKSTSLISQETNLSGLLINMEEFEECISRLLEIYRCAVLKVFSGFSCKLHILSEDIGRQCCIALTTQQPELEELEQMIERSARRLSENLGQKYACDDLIKHVQTDGLDLQKSLRGLGSRVRETYCILHEAVHLYDAHMMRSGLAQKLTMAAVEDLVTSNDALQLANEITFNIAIEQLRQGPEVDKLLLQYDAIVLLLSSTKNMYTLHRDAEIQKLEEYMRLLPAMTAAVLSEIEIFFEKHRPAGNENKFNLSSMTSPRYFSDGVHNQIPLALLQTDLQATALLNWKNGFLESLEGNKNIIPNELETQARQWIDERSGFLHMRYSMKMMSHAIRVERLSAAHDLRLTELRYHEKRLKDHTDAITNLIADVERDVSTGLHLDSPKLYPLLYWTDDIERRISQINADDVDIEVKKLKMSSYALRLTKYRHCFEVSIDPALENLHQIVQGRMQEARIANVRFLSQIRMFSEGGKYAAKEAERAAASLILCTNTLESNATFLLDELQQKRAQVLLLADQHISPLRTIIEGCVPKRGGDKRNQPNKIR